MTAIDFCERLRRDPSVANVPVVLITSEPPTDEERLRFGPDRVVLSKSDLTRDLLRTTIDRVLAEDAGDGKLRPV
jgi:CheY-like chemotaxis protein